MRRDTDANELRRQVDEAIEKGLAPERVVPLLVKLARAATVGSEAWLFAHHRLSELVTERDPWRASLLARRVTAICPKDHPAWATLALAQSLLGHFRFAAASYRRALALAPNDPWYAHNLGHLYDVVLGRPADALALLERAARAEPAHAEIAASYAHALARSGSVAQAKTVLSRAVKSGGTPEQMALLRWIEDGAPDRVARPSRAQAKRPKRKRREPD